MSGVLSELVPRRALALYEREAEVDELIDALDEELSPDEEQGLQARLADALQYAVDKREAYGLFLMRLDQIQANSKREIERLKLRIDHIENAKTRMRRYAVAAIRALGSDQKGKFRKLMGHTVTLFIRALPSSVEITDEAAIPSEFKRVSVQMPATLYERLCVLAPVIAELQLKDLHIDKEAIKRALEAGREVTGADLRLPGHDHTLVVK